VLEPHRAFVLERISQTPHLTLHALKQGIYLTSVRPPPLSGSLPARLWYDWPSRRGNVPMAKNGSANSVAIRDERGHDLKGMPGGPGRPLGSRNKLSEDFLCDMHVAWTEHGSAVLDRIITDRLEIFFWR
jgi:hypothetical protein